MKRKSENSLYKRRERSFDEGKPKEKHMDTHCREEKMRGNIANKGNNSSRHAIHSV